MATVGSYGESGSYERGTPVVLMISKGWQLFEIRQLKRDV